LHYEEERKTERKENVENHQKRESDKQATDWKVGEECPNQYLK
jgi:hypothetical protein